MCKLLVGQTLKADAPEFKKIIQMQYDTLRTQPNGVGALVVDTDNKVHVFREFKDYDLVFEEVDKLLPTAKLVALHTRIGTGGNKDLHNVHMFEENGFILAHNGFVYKTKNLDCKGCASSKIKMCKRHKKAEQLPVPMGFHNTAYTLPTDDCDTLEFLKNITGDHGDITKEVLESETNRQFFSGVGFLFNKKTNEATLFARDRSKKPIQLLTDKKSFGVFFSYEPTVEEKFIRNVYNNIFGTYALVGEKERKVTTRLKPITVPDGVYPLTTELSAEPVEFEYIDSITADTDETYDAKEWESETVASSNELRYQPNADEPPAWLAAKPAPRQDFCELCNVIKPLADIVYDEMSDAYICRDCSKMVQHA